MKILFHILGLYISKRLSWKVEWQWVAKITARGWSSFRVVRNIKKEKEEKSQIGLGKTDRDRWGCDVQGE